MQNSVCSRQTSDLRWFGFMHGKSGLSLWKSEFGSIGLVSRFEVRDTSLDTSFLTVKRVSRYRRSGEKGSRQYSVGRLQSMASLVYHCGSPNLDPWDWYRDSKFETRASIRASLPLNELRDTKG